MTDRELAEQELIAMLTDDEGVTIDRVKSVAQKLRNCEPANVVSMADYRPITAPEADGDGGPEAA